jgi:hypothetical protein
LGVPLGLLEREPHLARLEAWWKETAELGRVAFVAGEAGAGKTSLVRAFAARLPPGTVVLEENCEALSTPAPLARCWCSRGAPGSIEHGPLSLEGPPNHPPRKADRRVADPAGTPLLSWTGGRLSSRHPGCR